MWQAKATPTEKLLPKNFIFVKKNQKPEISFRRVGVYAGNISTDIDNKSEQSHYFIKITNETLSEKINEIVEYMNSVVYEFNNTVGPKSISKQEFTREIKAIKNEEKIKIIESLWKIIYSNKEADIYETNLMRRLAGLLYIDNKTMGDIKEKIKKEKS